jgi:alcohol-forming fatty acyl-CoA reductase
MVVNAMLASMAKHGGKRTTTAGLYVYHTTSSTVNPLLYEDIFQIFYQHFTRSPFTDAAGKSILVKPIQFCGNMEKYVITVRQVMQASEGLSDRAREKITKYTIHLGSIYEPYTFYDAMFENTNRGPPCRNVSGGEGDVQI